MKMKSYEEVKNLIETVCKKYTFSEVKKANKELKRELGDQIIKISTRVDYLGNLLGDYMFWDPDDQDVYTISWDFFNGIFESDY